MQDKFLDIRGMGFTGNFINLVECKPCYCGMPVESLTKSDCVLSKYYWDIKGLGGLNLGLIALSDEDSSFIIQLIDGLN